MELNIDGKIIEHPFKTLFGLNDLNELIPIINNLKFNSNIPFNKELMQIGVNFSLIIALEYIEGKRKRTDKLTLEGIISEGFGSAVIYIHQIK